MFYAAGVAGDSEEDPPEIDVTRPHSARMYDYYLGGYFL